MNILFAIGKGNLNSQIAQLSLYLGLKNKGVHIYLMGELTNEVESYLKANDASFEFDKIYPSKRFDKKYQEDFTDVIVSKKIDLVHFVSGKACKNGMIALKKHPKVKTVVYYGSVSLHWYDPTSYLNYLHPRINALIGNSNYVYEHAKKQFFGKQKEKAVRIFKGYSSDWYKDVTPFDYSQLNIPKNSIVVCSIGNHRKVKGTKYFLESSNYLNTTKDVHYILIGHNTDADFLTQIKDNSSIADKIHVLGQRNDVPSLLAGADMYVQTSLSEGFGRAISEAMSIGKPIVMTNAGGCTELIDENSGIVVPLKDAKAIGGAITKLVNDDALRTKMGANAKQRIDTVFSIERTVNETYALYKKLLKS